MICMLVGRFVGSQTLYSNSGVKDNIYSELSDPCLTRKELSNHCRDSLKMASLHWAVFKDRERNVNSCL